jgi:tetraacyldisaccharide 4'-kinase
MLREPASGQSRANIILITRTPENITTIQRQEYVNSFGISPGQQLYFTTMRYGELTPVYPGTGEKSADRVIGQADGILLVSGIANPQPLREYARSIHGNLAELNFPDHHHYRTKDLEKISASYRKLKAKCQEVLVLTTDKDAVRLGEHEPDPELRDALFSVPIEVHFLNKDKEEFDRQILNYVNSNKRSRILHQEADT